MLDGNRTHCLDLRPSRSLLITAPLPESPERMQAISFLCRSALWLGKGEVGSPILLAGLSNESLKKPLNKQMQEGAMLRKVFGMWGTQLQAGWFWGACAEGLLFGTTHPRITEYSESEETHKDHQVQPLREWPMQGSNVQSWHPYN